MSSPSTPSRRISPASIAELQRRRQVLVDAGLPDVRKAAEDEERLGYRATTSSPVTAERWLRGLEPLADHGTIALTWTDTGGGKGAFRLEAEGALFITSAEKLEDSPEGALDYLVASLKRRDQIPATDLASTFEDLGPRDDALRFELNLSIAKSRWLEDFLGEAGGCNARLFLFSHNFLKALEGLDQLEERLFAAGDRSTVVLLPESEGTLEGDFLACFGGDALDEIDDFLSAKRARDFERLERVRTLCDKQCRWKAAPKILTPSHFILLKGRLSGAAAAEIQAELSVVATQLAIGYLADRTDGEGNTSRSRFCGYKTCEVESGRRALRRAILDGGLDPRPLLRLFESTYENQSADQLRITRWLVTDALEEEPESNVAALLEKAGSIHASAGDQFEQLMRRNISEYFQARREVLEFLRRYTDDIAEAVRGLSAELTSNLYKTLGAIVGAIVAAKLTEKEVLAVLVTSLLYFIYVGFILVYLLPWTRRTLEIKKEEYDNNVRQLVRKDLLMEKDIERFQGQSFRDAEKMFEDVDKHTESIYRTLAGIALIVAIASALILLLENGSFSF